MQQFKINVCIIKFIYEAKASGLEFWPEVVHYYLLYFWQLIFSDC